MRSRLPANECTQKKTLGLRNCASCRKRHPTEIYKKKQKTGQRNALTHTIKRDHNRQFYCRASLRCDDMISWKEEEKYAYPTQSAPLISLCPSPDFSKGKERLTAGRRRGGRMRTEALIRTGRPNRAERRGATYAGKTYRAGTTEQRCFSSRMNRYMWRTRTYEDV